LTDIRTYRDDSVPQNVSLDLLIQALEPLSQDPIHINVFYKKPDVPVIDPETGGPAIDPDTGQFKMIESNPPTWRDRYETFPTRDAFDDWCQAQARGLVGAKGAIGITNYSWHGRRLEKSFAWTHRTFLDCDNAGTYEKIVAALAPTGLRFGVHESSGSVRRRTLGTVPPNSLPLKWHLDLAFSRPLANPLDEVYPQGETEVQAKAREAALSEEEQSKLRWRASYLRKEWKRKQRFLIRFFSKLGELDDAQGKAGFDLSVTQMCQFRYLGVRYRQDGPEPVTWNSRGPLGLNFEKLLELAGYEAAPWTEWAPRRKAVVKISNADGSVDTYQRSGGYEDLDAEIQRSMTMDRFLGEVVGISPDTVNGGGGGCSKSWTCPVPTHPDPGRRTLETDRSKAWDGDWFRCWGDCDTQGGVIKFATLYWGISYRAARMALAKHLGLNPKDYRGRLEKISSEFKEASETDQTARIKLTGPAPAPAATPEPVKEPVSAAKKVLLKAKRAKLSKKKLKNVEAWVEKHWERFKNQEDLLRALTKTILMLQGTEKDVGVVATTLWFRFAHLYEGDYPALLFEVANTYERLRTGQPSVGVGFLKKSVGTWELFQLAGAFRRDGFEFKPAVKYLVGFGLTLGEDKTFLDSQWFEHDIDLGRMPNLEEVDSPEYKKHEKRRTPFKNALRRPGACSQCEQRVTGDHGRPLGPSGPDGRPTHLTRRIVCVSKLCLFCMVLQTISEAEILEDMWKERISKKKPTWVVQGTVEKIEYLSEVKADLSRIRDAKLGILGWGSDYKPQLTVFVNDDRAAIAVKSALSISQKVAAGRRGEEIPRPASKTWRVTDPKKAVGIAIEARLSFNIFGKRLVEEQRADELADWLWWAVGKVPVRNPRKEDALNWPTKAQVQAQVKQNKGESWEPDLWPGEVMNYELFHRATGYSLGHRAKIPYGIDDAARLMQSNMGFRHALAMKLAEDRRAKGNKEVMTDLENHRMPLRGADTAVA
jgi:hypothetical protein